MFRPTELSGPAPILVWIHGGGLAIGSGMDAYYNATYLAKDGAQIVINISYRLGILGGSLKRFLFVIISMPPSQLQFKNLGQDSLMDLMRNRDVLLEEIMV